MLETTGECIDRPASTRRNGSSLYSYIRQSERENDQNRVRFLRALACGMCVCPYVVCARARVVCGGVWSVRVCVLE